MGKTSDDLQREIARHRVGMEQRITRLQERVRGDVSDAGNAVSDSVMERTRLRERVERHPLTTVAGAFAAGMALGMASPPMAGAGAPQPKRGFRDDQRTAPNGGGLIGQALDSASALLGGTLRDEIRDLMDNLLGSKEAAPGQASPPSSRQSLADRPVDGHRPDDAANELATAGARPLMGNRELRERNR